VLRRSIRWGSGLVRGLEEVRLPGPEDETQREQHEDDGTSTSRRINEHGFHSRRSSSSVGDTRHACDEVEPACKPRLVVTIR